VQRVEKIVVEAAAQQLWRSSFISTPLPPASRLPIRRVRRSVDGVTGEHSCMRLASGRHRGQCGCIHRDPQGRSHAEEIFVSDLMRRNIFARGSGGYRKENRPESEGGCSIRARRDTRQYLSLSRLNDKGLQNL
jgi:hypothetical protein